MFTDDPDQSGLDKPRFGTPTKSWEELVVPDLGSNLAADAGGVWDQLLNDIDVYKVSDLIFIEGQLWFGIGKQCYPILKPGKGKGQLSPELNNQLLKTVLSGRPNIVAALEKSSRVEQDFSCAMLHPSKRTPVRFRVNFSRANELPFVVMRPLPETVPSPAEIGLDAAFMNRITGERRGIVVVAGTTNSGKSTTIASILEGINQHFRYHIVTLEDPVEIRFTPKLSIFSQREVGEDTESFKSGMRAAMRQSPHIIVIGELRDFETVEMACAAAESGHLVITTVHADGVAMAATRLVDLAPPSKSQELRNLLSTQLILAMYQTLPRTRAEVGGGRICLREILWMDTASSNLMREGRDKSLVQHMHSTADKGNRTFVKAFEMERDKIHPEDADILKKCFAEQFGRAGAKN